MARVQLLLSTLVGAVVFATVSAGCSQPALTSVRQTDDLARQLASGLREADKQGVLVLDLYTAEEKSLPFGAWLADELSTSLGNLGQGIRTVDRADLNAALYAQHLSPQDERELNNGFALSRAVRANTLILGSYGAADNGIGVTLVAFHVPEDGVPESKSSVLETIRGKIILTQDLATHLGVPLDSLRPKDGIAVAGIGGVTVPECLKCTPPSAAYVPDVDVVGFLRDKRGTGSLELKFIVTAEGRTTEITVSNPIGYGFDDLYLKAAKDFEFKPAVDADNKPIFVRTQLIFHINLR